jgi:hypothetical protein
MNGMAKKITVKPSELAEILEFAITQGLNILLVGPPGIGKTYIVNWVCKKLKAALEVFYTSTSDPTEVKGFPFPKKNSKGEAEEADFLLYGQLANLMKAKKLTVAFLDDFGQANGAVQAGWMNPLQSKIINGKKLPECVRFILATNRKEDGAGVSGLLEPIKSRMHLIIHIEPDIDDFLKWWLSEGLPVEIYAYLRNNPGRLIDFKPSKDILPYPCPRSWEYAGRILQGKPSDNILLACLAGAVGEPDAMALMEFIEIMKNAVDPEAVIKSPEGAPIPERTTILFGLLSALIYRLSEKTMKPILKYARRLPVEFASKLRVDALMKATKDGFDIQNTTEYGELIRYTGNLLMA